MGLRPGRAKGPWVGDNIPTGVVNAGANVGAGTGLVFRDITGNTINLRTLSAGTAVSIVTAGDIITITNTAPESTTVANVGTGSGQSYRDMTGPQINLKTIKQGTGITVTNNADDVTITCTVTGESTTVTNVGTGSGQVYRDMTVAQINLKTIKQGTGITVTNNADDVTITCTVTGESTTVSNVGTGTGNVYRDMTGAQINLKTIKQGTLITVTNNADDVTIATTAQNNTASNVGTGTGIYDSKSGSDLRFRSLANGTGISLSLASQTITITNSSPESTTVANVGTGTGQVYRDMTVAQVNLKTIKQGTGITVTNNADDVTITCTVTGTIGGSGTINKYAVFTSATTIGDGALEQVAGNDMWVSPAYNLWFGGTSANGMLSINGSFTGFPTYVSARHQLLISAGSTTKAEIDMNDGNILINSIGNNVDVTIRGTPISAVIAKTDAGDNALQITGRLVTNGVIDNAGAAYAGGTSASPTAIDLSSLMGNVVRVAPTTTANRFYQLTNPKNYQVIFVINEGTRNAQIAARNDSATYQYTIPSFRTAGINGAFFNVLIYSPVVANGTGGWVQVNQQYEALQLILTDAATIAVDATIGDCLYTVTLGGNRTLGNPSNPTRDGQRILFRIRQDGTGGRTLAYDTKYRFSTDLPSPTLSTGINKIDYLGFIYDSTDDKWDFVGKVFGF